MTCIQKIADFFVLYQPDQINKRLRLNKTEIYCNHQVMKKVNVPLHVIHQESVKFDMLNSKTQFP